MPDIDIGVVGTGFMAQLAHIRCFQQVDGATVTALVSSRPNHLQRVADHFHIDKRYQHYEQLAEDEDIDMAVVIVPPEMNAPICADLLRAGKHVFSEKPVALAAADGRKLSEIAESAGRRYLTGFMKRCDAGVQAAKHIIDDWQTSGQAGNMLFARMHAFSGGDWKGNIDGLFDIIESDEPMSDKETTSAPDWLAEEYAGHWGPYYYFNHPHSHHLDLLNFFLGTDFEVLHADWSHDVKLATIEYGDVPANLEVGQCEENNRWDEQMDIYFEGGSVQIKTPPPLLINAPAEVRVHEMGDKQRKLKPHAEYSWSFLRQAQSAVDVIAEDAEPVCTIDDATAQLELLEAIFRHLQGL